MSEAAIRSRAARRRWAEPGSRHDTVVKLAKFGLPIAGAGLLVLLAVAPFDKDGDVSFILDKKGVDRAEERMRIESARYVGEDSKGNKFVIRAERAVQPTSDQPLVAIEGMQARLELGNGRLGMAALKGQYDLDRKLIRVVGPIHVSGPDGYALRTRDVSVDLGAHSMRSSGRVSGRMELGEFEAGRLSADLDSRTLRLEDGVRLKIRQGAVR
ncbi:LPS export ABC transporter periplasmic protein LptC [Sphingomonas mesophila]|uniref:LPS export ABC transporter periplasmic protein LptC n=1 Tax=Sphingomonas mesophila TaxID=2303576 RepID=UPI000E56D612|nr:LPS export ABC transporter periplasmic protein LptC [Sphingomonas mesophila]